jgi:YVTN family beta-propeller protein
MIAAGGQPGAVAVNPVTNKIYVANFSDNNITVIDGATNSTATVPVGATPQALAVNPVTNKIYVANSFNVAVIDGATNATANFADVGALLVEVNPITNKIYFATGFNSLMVLDGATNNIQTVRVPNSLTLSNLAVNPATNKIYLADADRSNVTVIDGATNTIIATIPTTLVFSIGLAVNPVAVNPVTDTVYLAAGNVNGGSILALQEKRAQLTPVQAAIAPFPGNITGVLTPTFQLSVAPLALPVKAMYMQVDTWQGQWTAAANNGGGQFTATLTTPLQPGVHIAYAWADPQDDPLATGSQEPISASPMISNIAAYVFLVAPPSTGLSATSLDFGQQTVNTNSLARTVTLTNANGPLDISGISVSGHFQESDNCPAQLEAGTTCTINLIFSPTSADLGNTVTGSVTVTDDNNGTANNTDTIALTGVGSSPATASLSSNSLTFGNQEVGSTSSPAQGLTVTNSGTLALNIASIAISGANGGDFAQTNTCGTSLAAGANCTISVTFTPSGTGNRSATLVITDGAADSPQNVSLGGTGVRPTSTLSTANLSFPTTYVAVQAAAQNVTVSNTGTAALSISSIVIGGGTNSGDFSQTNTCGTSLAAGANCAISVAFTPSSTGSRTASLTILDDAAGSPQTVALSGAGISVSLGIASGGSTTQTVKAGQTATYNLQIAATGGAAATDQVSVSISCSGAPEFANCNPSAATVTATPATPGTFSIAVTTAGSAVVAPLNDRPEFRIGPPMLLRLMPFSVLALLLISVAMIRRMQNPSGELRVHAVRFGLAGCFVLLLGLSAVAMNGCSSSSKTTTLSTPAGTYTLTVMATASGKTQSTSLTLVVQ